jgi:hypothetical protein
MKIILLILLFVPMVLFAQEENKSSKIKLDYNASYYGNNLWNPGLKFGAEYVFHKNVVEKAKKKKTKTKTHLFLINGDLGFFWDPKDYTALFNYYGVTYRKINTKGFNYNFGLSPLGVFRSFLSETYEVKDDGSIQKVFLPGRFYYAPTFVMGIGKNRKEKRINAWFLNVSAITLIKYNADFVPLINIEFGFRFDLSK